MPGTPTDPSELFGELSLLSARINATTRLRTIADAIHTLEQPSAQSSGAHFFLLELNPDTLEVTGFPANKQDEAQAAYVNVEKKIAGLDSSDAVLVSVDSVAALRRAYPNYFLDTRVFADILEDALANRLAFDTSAVS